MTLNQILGLYPEQNDVEIVFHDYHGQSFRGHAEVVARTLRDKYLDSTVTGFVAVDNTLKIWI